MASVDNATRIFSHLTDLVVAEFLSKDEFAFPLNDSIKLKLAAGRNYLANFELQMKAYAALDDAVMERYLMVPWLAKTPIDCAYCEGFFSLALNKSVFGAHQRCELAQVASRVLQKAWPKLIQSLVLARFSTSDVRPQPNYSALSSLISNLILGLNNETNGAITHCNAIELLSSWWAQRDELSSEMTCDDQIQFLRWAVSENLTHPK